MRRGAEGVGVRPMKQTNEATNEATNEVYEVVIGCECMGGTGRY